MKTLECSNDNTLSMPKMYDISDLYNTYAKSDSPLTMSDNDSETNSQESISIQIHEEFPKKYKYRNELSIFITFLKGQKNIYIYADHITQIKLNILIVTSLLLTSGVTIFAPLGQNNEWTIKIIAILNALATIVISFTSYLKLEKSCAMYSHTAKQYEKIGGNLELHNEFQYYDETDNTHNTNGPKIYDLENKMKEIIEEKYIEIPSEIKILYPIMSNVNVFGLIKKLNNHNNDVKKEYTKIKKEVALIMKKYNGISSLRVKNRLEYLLTQKEKAKKNINHYDNAFTYFDELCVRENTLAQAYKNIWACVWFKSTYHFKKNPYHNNPLVDEYILSIT